MSHGQPKPDSNCVCCYDDMTAENYCEYQAVADGPWLPSPCCVDCVDNMLQNKWRLFRSAIETDDCLRSKRRLLEKGPPINLYDPSMYPCPDDGEVHMFWVMSTGQEKSAKLEGSFVGQERQDYWDLQKVQLVGLDLSSLEQQDAKK